MNQRYFKGTGRMMPLFIFTQAIQYMYIQYPVNDVMKEIVCLVSRTYAFISS